MSVSRELTEEGGHTPSVDGSTPQLGSQIVQKGKGVSQLSPIIPCPLLPDYGYNVTNFHVFPCYGLYPLHPEPK